MLLMSFIGAISFSLTLFRIGVTRLCCARTPPISNETHCEVRLFGEIKTMASWQASIPRIISSGIISPPSKSFSSNQQSTPRDRIFSAIVLAIQASRDEWLMNTTYFGRLGLLEDF